MITINQGRSSQKPYFLIADPEKPRAIQGDQVLCVNPKTKVETKGLVMARWSFDWDVDPLAGLILLEYGVRPDQLRKGLQALDPEFNSSRVSLLLIKEII
ncbi:MAG: hypothetical protein WCI31_06240 [Prolixibacteraceae bacterium]